MAHRPSYLGRNTLILLSPTKRIRLNTTKCYSISSKRRAGDYPASKYPSSSPHQYFSTGPIVFNSAGNYQGGSQGYSKTENSSLNPGHTLFTSPGATKTAVLDKVNLLEMPADPGNAVVIFASPRHASWVTDPEFMAGLVHQLFRKQIKSQEKGKIASSLDSFHTLTAVVDGLHPKNGSTEMQEGLSLQFGSLDRLLPGLWDDPSVEMPCHQRQPLGPDFESAHVSVVLREPNESRSGHTVTLPLANTLFHNGQRTTLIATKWVGDSFKEPHVSSCERLPKENQMIGLTTTPSLQDAQELRMLCPLVPITHPREIVEGLGNILAKVDIDGELAPASKELQFNIPLLLQARQSRSEYDPKSARVGVWALILPERLFVQRENPRKSSTQDPISTLNTKTNLGQWKHASGKLAFEMESDPERMLWQQTGMMGELLSQGGRLHKILSGGGEWGAKASLLSLDPQISYGKESEEDELDRFQRSFHGEDTTEGAIVRPGDYVQFFVDGGPDLAWAGSGSKTLSPTSRAQYPSTAFGVGDFSKEDYATTTADASVTNSRELVKLAENHFGAFSAEGMFLETVGRLGGGHVNTQKSTTKVTAPGTIMLS